MTTEGRPSSVEASVRRHDERSSRGSYPVTRRPTAVALATFYNATAVTIASWLISACGSSDPAPSATPDPLKAAQERIAKAERGHIYDAQPNGIVGKPDVKVTCPRARAAGEFACTARLQLALPATDGLELARDQWRVKTTASAAIASARRENAAISRFAQADATLDCVGQFIDAAVGGATPPPEMVALLLPCQR